MDAAKKRLLLTHKKTLVEFSLPLLADYEDAKPGGTHHGVVIATGGGKGGRYPFKCDLCPPWC